MTIAVPVDTPRAPTCPLLSADGVGQSPSTMTAAPSPSSGTARPGMLRTHLTFSPPLCTPTAPPTTNCNSRLTPSSGATSAPRLPGACCSAPVLASGAWWRSYAHRLVLVRSDTAWTSHRRRSSSWCLLQLAHSAFAPAPLTSRHEPARASHRALAISPDHPALRAFAPLLPMVSCRRIGLAFHPTPSPSLCPQERPPYGTLHDHPQHHRRLVGLDLLFLQRPLLYDSVPSGSATLCPTLHITEGVHTNRMTTQLGRGRARLLAGLPRFKDSTD